MVERAKILFQSLAATGSRNNDDSLTESRYALTGWQCDCPQDLHLLQILLHKLHRHRPLADGRGDALDRTRSNISRSEYAGTARLQQKRRTPRGPKRLRQNRTGANKPPRVRLDFFGKPIGPRHGPDKAEERRGFQRPHLSGPVVDYLYRVQV